MAALPVTTAIELQLKSGWLTVRFNQPDNRNALSQELTGDLIATLNAVRDDREVRGITLRGRGGIFCSGADLKAFRSGHQGGRGGSREAVIEQSKRGAGMFDLVNTMPQVVIAIVEGAAMAGGFGLACCCDVVICDAGAKFAMTETAIGLSPAQISPFVIQKLGYATARRLMLTAARFDGKEAGALGFADFVAEGTEALEAIETKIKAQVLKCAPGAVADTKALILALPRLDREQTVQAAAENFAGRMLSDEAKEGVASFVEKRKPRWAVDP
jgi:isohexenylglutaconyl-CoA hydratase